MVFKKKLWKTLLTFAQTLSGNAWIEWKEWTEALFQYTATLTLGVGHQQRVLFIKPWCLGRPGAVVDSGCPPRRCACARAFVGKTDFVTCGSHSEMPRYAGVSPFSSMCEERLISICRRRWVRDRSVVYDRLCGGFDFDFFRFLFLFLSDDCTPWACLPR